MKSIFSIAFIFITHVVNCQHWEGVGGGTDSANHFVYSFLEHNNVLYVAGGFGYVAGGTINSEGLGIWNGTNWLAGNTDFFAGAPYTFTMYQDMLVMGGQFQRINGNKYCRKIALQDSILGWVPLGSGVTNGSRVNCMAVYNGDLFIGGQFTEVDSTISANRLARWDGTAWYAMGSGVQGGFGEVNDMAVFQGELYVCGDFTSIDGLYAPGICRWNGISWDTVSSGINGLVKCLYVDSVNQRLYVGGHITMAGGISCPTGVAYWDGQNWFPVGTDPYLPAVDLIHYNGILYNTSFVYDAVNSNGDTINHFAWFDGVNWNPVPGGLSSRGNSFSIYQNELYVGGSFQYAGDSLVYGIAKWIPGSLGEVEFPEEKLPIKAMPNPTKDEVVIEMTLKEKMNLQLRIIDIGGKIIHSDSLSGNVVVQHKINTAGFTSGTYMISVYENNRLLGSEKMVIQR